MFKTLFRSALAALTIGTGFAGMGAGSAAAQEVRIVIDDGIRVEPAQYRDYDGRDFDRRDRRDFDRGDFDRRDRGGSCRARLALNKAYDIGLNRPRIVRENRRVVVVDGWRRGRPATVRFANDRGCPVLDVRR